MWSRCGDLYTLIEKRKKENGRIPSETCPSIDGLLKLSDLIPEDKRENYVKDLEKLREDNGKLRGLGIEWYNFCEELSEEADEIIEELEEERDRLEKEVEQLKDEISRE